ncbi:hypothetical protein QA612_02170 [Evansella sp. AB-P1]|uniref:hypothetical protein n=1 Tax=Evansella sp. AB-P1 TaxID=3037653 RepID=UPI00241EF4F9|nr:hypothetical protein [Evansella sp. AB-P1]MDG5786279.1 hypothetical protein [Evansella sp. AB-P1]
MKELKGVWKILSLEISRSTLIFWSILLFFLLLGIMFSVFIPFPGVMNWNTNVPVMIFLIITGARMFKVCLLYGSSFGCTRKNIYIGAVTFLTILSLISAIVHNVVFSSFSYFLETMEISMFINNVIEFANIQTNFFIFLLMDFAIFMFFASISYILSIIWHQIGTIPLYGILGVFLLSVLLPTMHPYWRDLGLWIYDASYLSLVSLLLLCSVILLSFPYFFTKQIKIFSREKPA